MSDATRLTLPITGMTCANCAFTVERSLKKADGVSDAAVNFATEQASVVFDPAMLKPALLHLKEASRMDAEVPRTWRLLAIAYGRLNQKGMMVVSLAEEAIRINQPREAVRYSEQATKMLPKGSPGWVRAQDIRREGQKLIEAEG